MHSVSIGHAGRMHGQFRFAYCTSGLCCIQTLRDQHPRQIPFSRTVRWIGLRLALSFVGIAASEELHSIQ